MLGTLLKSACCTPTLFPAQPKLHVGCRRRLHARLRSPDPSRATQLSMSARAWTYAAAMAMPLKMWKVAVGCVSSEVESQRKSRTSLSEAWPMKAVGNVIRQQSMAGM